MFIGKEEEIQAIERIINQKGCKGAVIYGRRRLGKTELLKHCLLSEPPISRRLVGFLIKDNIKEVEQVKSTNLKAIKYGFISRSGYDLKNKYPYELLKLEDLYY